MAAEEDEKLLNAFKVRMRILHDKEDDNLKSILNGSKASIKRLCGSDDITNDSIKELIIERSRYVYNDQVEFFYGNFQSELMGVSLELYEGDKDKDE